ncbi:NUDIX hydrolase [Geosporobacter ferrireducens]|uniref:NUDIX hydrolase n=1 Tax=Geosporobacter ferrireducens TaxID=1424294 RepID=UPI00139AF693|nr:NUDIX domain-containing protein [Geosporobacter ferrireducens]MTI57461.1 NUDIX domain-containing protein [Geosporobacter ferrireducens]
METFAIPGVGGIIEKVVDGVTYILIQDRCKADCPLERGLIEIPAGKIQAFENIYNCLRREVREETGLEITMIEGEGDTLVYEGNGYKVLNYTPFCSIQNIEGTYPIMVQIFICRAAGELLDKSDEARNMRWVSLEELEELLDKKEKHFYPMHVITLRKYLKIKSTNADIPA